MITSLIAYSVVAFWLAVSLVSVYAALFVLAFLFNYASNLIELHKS